MPHRDPLVAAQARIEALERALEIAREERADLAMFASFHAELELLRAENEALRAELAGVRHTLAEEREARRSLAGAERASLEAEIAALREQIIELRAAALAARAEAMRSERRSLDEAEPDPDPNVRRVEPDRIGQGGACPACHAERALAMHPAESGLASVVCAVCGYLELRA